MVTDGDYKMKQKSGTGRVKHTNIKQSAKDHNTTGVTLRSLRVTLRVTLRSPATSMQTIIRWILMLSMWMDMSQFSQASLFGSLVVR